VRGPRPRRMSGATSTTDDAHDRRHVHQGGSRHHRLAAPAGGVRARRAGRHARLLVALAAPRAAQPADGLARGPVKGPAPPGASGAVVSLDGAHHLRLDRVDVERRGRLPPELVLELVGLLERPLHAVRSKTADFVQRWIRRHGAAAGRSLRRRRKKSARWPWPAARIASSFRDARGAVYLAEPDGWIEAAIASR